MLALPALQNLHEKYNDKGLKLIGIDPYDTKEKDDIDNFLAKRGVTYTVLFGGKDIAKEYHVSSYPTIYLIDKKGFNDENFLIIIDSLVYKEEISDESLDDLNLLNLAITRIANISIKNKWFINKNP